MKLQFDAKQQYQLDGVAAVTDLFEGQPQGAPEYSVNQVGDWGGLFAGPAWVWAPGPFLRNVTRCGVCGCQEVLLEAVELEREMVQ